MVLDAIGTERQFIDHMAPIWRALPASVRGTFHVEASLAAHAVRRSIDPALIDADAIRRSSRTPSAVVEAGPSCLTAGYGDTKVARRMGYRRFAYLEHGI